MVVIFFKQAYFYCFPYKKVRADACTRKVVFQVRGYERTLAPVKFGWRGHVMWEPKLPKRMKNEE